MEILPSRLVKVVVAVVPLYLQVERPKKREGTYKYFKTGDIYSGTFVEGLKSGEGCYEYGEDLSKLKGTWDKGVFVTGEWVLKGAGVYTGSFQNGKPAGPGLCFKLAPEMNPDTRHFLPELHRRSDMSQAL